MPRPEDLSTETLSELYDSGEISMEQINEYVRRLRGEPSRAFKKGDKVMVKDRGAAVWSRQYFACKRNGAFWCFLGGRTEWSADGAIQDWHECRFPTEEELS